jgi:GH15 family glucan-1,4-alpha-glucosidase
MSNTAIADHALLSDRHSTALVDRSGSVDWLGFPRFDSPSVFGRLLGPDAGHWSITPRRGLVQRPPLRGPDAGAGNQRDEIWETVIRQAWSKEAGAFTQYVGSTALDAANLMMAIVGFLPATDPRMLATIDAIEERLTDDRGLVYRYRIEDGVDGLAGEEGTFLLCTFWLAQALALADQVDRARAVFERAAAFANDLGLLA